MPPTLRFPLLVLALCTSSVEIASAEDAAAPDKSQWSPTRAPRKTESPESPGQVRTAESFQSVDESAESVHELLSHEKVLEPSPTEQLPEEFEEIAGRLYNSAGWYSAPEWNGMTWRPGTGDRFGEFSFGGVSLEPIEKWDGLSFTHGSGFHFLAGPSRTDLPPRVFDFNWGLHWFGEVTQGWWADLAFSAGLYTDFEDSVRKGWRFPSHAVITWEMSPEVQPVGGVRYFDRDNLGLLPVGGLILRPDEGIRVELVYPQPRVAWRVSADVDEENWLSISGRIGGGEWAIERSGTGLADTVTYNDYQIVLALDTVEQSGSISSVEIGYVFERDLEYRSGQGNFEPPETFFVRLVTRK